MNGSREISRSLDLILPVSETHQGWRCRSCHDYRMPVNWFLTPRRPSLEAHWKLFHRLDNMKMIMLATYQSWRYLKYPLFFFLSFYPIWVPSTPKNPIIPSFQRIFPPWTQQIYCSKQEVHPTRSGHRQSIPHQVESAPESDTKGNKSRRRTQNAKHDNWFINY